MTPISLARKIWRRLPLDGAGVLSRGPLHGVGARNFWKRVPAWVRPAAILASRILWLVSCPLKAVAETRNEYARSRDVWASIWIGWATGKTPHATVLHRALARDDRTRLRLADEIQDNRQGILTLQGLGTKEDIALANDKLALTRQLECKGLPVVKIETVVGRGEVPDLSTAPWTGPEKLLVKPRRGSHAAGLFSVRPLPGGRFSVSGGSPIDAAALAQLVAAAAKWDDLLVQPFIRPSADTRDLSPQAPAVIRAFTMREKPGRRASVASAFLKVLSPARDTPDMGTVETLPVVPIALETGMLEQGILFEEPRKRVSRLPWSDTPLCGLVLPTWPQVREMVICASAVLPDTPVIGWDVLLGPQGPLILEANTGISILRAKLWHFEHGLRSPLDTVLEGWA